MSMATRRPETDTCTNCSARWTKPRGNEPLQQGGGSVGPQRQVRFGSMPPLSLEGDNRLLPEPWHGPGRRAYGESPIGVAAAFIACGGTRGRC
jgi:hypothetical protein